MIILAKPQAGVPFADAGRANSSATPLVVLFAPKEEAVKTIADASWLVVSREVKAVLWACPPEVEDNITLDPSRELRVNEPVSLVS